MCGNAAKLTFHCGVCARRLHDNTALFTSCGHFFCATAEAECTSLKAGSPAGACEQCGAKCDAGTLTGRAHNYDSRVQSFVFLDLPAELKSLAEILEFRAKHSEILSEAAASLSIRNAELERGKVRQAQEIAALRSRNDALAADVARLSSTNNSRAPGAITSAHAQRIHQHEHYIASSRKKEHPQRIEPTPAQSQTDPSRYFPRVPHESGTGAPAHTNISTEDGSHPQGRGSRIRGISHALGKTSHGLLAPGHALGSQIHTAANMRRAVIRAPEPSISMGQTSEHCGAASRIADIRRTSGRTSGFAQESSCANRRLSVPMTDKGTNWGSSQRPTLTGGPSLHTRHTSGYSAYTGSVQKPTFKTPATNHVASALSRYAHMPGTSGTTAGVTGLARSRGVHKPGAWQARVSTVPRPSATPDRLRRPVRKARPDMNPLGSRR